METVFGTAFEYKLIYVFAIHDEAHKGLLKIGDTTIQSDASIDALFPNCKTLNQAALSRIKQYTNTAVFLPSCYIPSWLSVLLEARMDSRC